MNNNSKAWIAALRSGEYKQICGAFSSLDKHCVFGVAIDLMERDGIVVPKDKRGIPIPSTELSYLIIDWLGLKSQLFILSDGIPTSIIALNDVLCLNFNQIACTLEKYQDQIFHAA